MLRFKSPALRIVSGTEKKSLFLWIQTLKAKYKPRNVWLRRQLLQEEHNALTRQELSQLNLYHVPESLHTTLFY